MAVRAGCRVYIRRLAGSLICIFGDDRAAASSGGDGDGLDVSGFGGCVVPFVEGGAEGVEGAAEQDGYGERDAQEQVDAVGSGLCRAVADPVSEVFDETG
jgi:hypothetical protein